jgi:hypothetical protein
MVVAREQFADLVARLFDGAMVIDGQRIIAHKSGMHVVRTPAVDHVVIEARRPLDRDNDWSDV